MEEVCSLCTESTDDGELTALAYYMYAVRERLRDAMPTVGPSVDRRSLAYVQRLAHSANIKGLVCFSCAQIYTWVRSWKRMYDAPGSDAESGEDGSRQKGGTRNIDEDDAESTCLYPIPLS